MARICAIAIRSANVAISVRFRSLPPARPCEAGAGCWARDVADDADPAFLLVGLMYAVTPDVTVDVGYKKGISQPEADREMLFGLTIGS